MVSTPILATSFRRLGAGSSSPDPGFPGGSTPVSIRHRPDSCPHRLASVRPLSDWLTDLNPRQPDTRVGWLSLDDGDNDLTRFMAHLVAALESAELDVDAAVLESLTSASAGAALTSSQRHRSSR